MTWNPALPRRDFIKLAGATAAASITTPTFAATNIHVAIVIDAADPIDASAPVRWAAEKLQRAIIAKGATADILTKLTPADTTVLVASVHSPFAPHAAAPLHGPESFRLSPIAAGTWLAATDQRGFIYGLLELAERIQSTGTVALHLTSTIEEKPANAVRSIARMFCSELEDKPWFYNKEQWHDYLDMLAASRFNRFALTLGLGYDFPKGVTGDYLHFPYPYLLDVPGYNVRAVPLSDAERTLNFETLRFIAAQTAARGLDFQLGLWTHAYEWTDSPHSDHHITGLTAETHAPYCRDALAMLLKACPEITGVTMRVHGESGIPEGSYPFWQTLFEAIAKCGRKIEIDMHAKGINQIMIDMAVATGMTVKVSPKYSAEHQSLGYHQADIRELEIPRANRMETGVFSVSNGERRFTRYGYADLFTADRKFDVLFRQWPGTQRHLLSADPATAAAYGRTSHFCGASGLEIFEPLSFKGREGSGQPGGRNAYADTSLNPKRGDWQKFEHYYRVWGRLLYNPDAAPETWQRSLRADFGPATPSIEEALANASRILPLLTSAHLPSASNHALWYEIYDNMPIVATTGRPPYGDTPDPKIFATVSPLDPQLFSTIAEHAADVLASRTNAKYSPAEVAEWIEDLTNTAGRIIAQARSQIVDATAPAFRRIEEDVLIQIGIGRFFATKIRSAMLYEIFKQTHNTEAGRLALAEYRKAREAWNTMAQRAATIYLANISYGETPMRRGHWKDRLPAIDRDIASMEASMQQASPSQQEATAAMNAITTKPKRAATACNHIAPLAFHPGQPLTLSLSATSAPASINLFYRHVNHAERWQSLPMERTGASFQATIPAAYTQSLFPLQYYFELHTSSAAWLYPAFNATLSNQPYYVIARA